MNSVRPPNTDQQAVNELVDPAETVYRGQLAYSLSIGPADAIAVSDDEEMKDEDQGISEV